MSAPPDKEMNGPLDGLRVLDLTTTFMGPYCTLLLAHMGADVIKVEAPGGDIVRNIGPERNPGMGTIFLNANHGKRSVVLDLKRPEGRATLDRLVESTDVLVSNMRPKAVDTLDIGPDRLRAVNDRLIYCSLTGFGAGGPYRDLAAYDDVIQAVSGLAAVQGAPGQPAYVRTPVADKIVGIMGTTAILAAVAARERTGQGQLVEVPMFETMAQFMLLDQQGGHLFQPPIGPTGYSRTSSPFRKPYRTADGHVGVVVYTDRQWLSFFRLIDRLDLLEDPRFGTISARTRHIDDLYEIVEQALLTRSSAEWLELLAELGIPCVPILSTAELLDDEHLRAVNFFDYVEHPTEGALRMPRLPIGFSAHPATGGRPAPRLGEHGAQVLSELGVPDDEIEHLIEIGALGEPSEIPSATPSTIQEIKATS
jgi:crotonobetainyl-CoA:carnitine CoA-transferase CaiB-like acyl-CoA transferase